MFEFTAVHGEQPRNPAVNHGHGKQPKAAAGWAEFVLHRSQNRKAAAGKKSSHRELAENDDLQVDGLGVNDDLQVDGMGENRRILCA